MHELEQLGKVLAITVAISDCGLALIVLPTSGKTRSTDRPCPAWLHSSRHRHFLTKHTLPVALLPSPCCNSKAKVSIWIQPRQIFCYVSPPLSQNRARLADSCRNLTFCAILRTTTKQGRFTANHQLLVDSWLTSKIKSKVPNPPRRRQRWRRYRPLC